jgi:two-component system response regulator GlrR
VRELRSFCEHLVALAPEAATPEPPSAGAPPALAPGALADLPFKEAKARWVAEFDVAYLGQLLERCDFNIAEASRRSGIDRVHLFRLVKKYGLRQR